MFFFDGSTIVVLILAFVFLVIGGIGGIILNIKSILLVLFEFFLVFFILYLLVKGFHDFFKGFVIWFIGIIFIIIIGAFAMNISNGGRVKKDELLDIKNEIIGHTYVAVKTISDTEIKGKTLTEGDRYKRYSIDIIDGENLELTISECKLKNAGFTIYFLNGQQEISDREWEIINSSSHKYTYTINQNIWGNVFIEYGRVPHKIFLNKENKPYLIEKIWSTINL